MRVQRNMTDFKKGRKNPNRPLSPFKDSKWLLSPSIGSLWKLHTKCNHISTDLKYFSSVSPRKLWFEISRGGFWCHLCSLQSIFHWATNIRLTFNNPLYSCEDDIIKTHKALDSYSIVNFYFLFSYFPVMNKSQHC